MMCANCVFHYVAGVCCERSTKQEMKDRIAAECVCCTVEAHQPRPVLDSPLQAPLLFTRELTLSPYRKNQIAMIEVG